MRISGLIIIRNGIKLGYPFIQSIKSILPVCNEVIIGVGDSEDGTKEAIEKIGDKKIKIVDTKWDDSHRTGGNILSYQTNLVMPHCKGDWIFYIQADEVIHEKDYGKIKDAAERYMYIDPVDGLAFNYLHFYGSYYTVQKARNWYAEEVRLIKNKRDIVSHGDAQGFRRHRRKIKAINIGAEMFHYGWARPPEVMVKKIKDFHKLWHDDEWIKKNCSDSNLRSYYKDLGNLVDFKHTHPAVMYEIVNKKDVGFINECKKIYIKERKLKHKAKDLLRRVRILKKRNFRLLNPRTLK